MLDLCNSIEASIASQNWYAALITALTLPDICGSIEYPGFKGKWVERIYINRYTKWFDEFLGEDYKVYSELDPNSPTYPFRLDLLQKFGHHLKQLSEFKYVETFLNGFECYLLRCNYLHEGVGRISEDKARDVLNDFIFIAPRPFGNVHKNLMDGKNSGMAVQLQVDLFARGISDKARIWWEARPDKEAHEGDFLKIQ